eukprot:scaffold3604_cov100-Skeletonema_marinoi.AAC.5
MCEFNLQFLPRTLAADNSSPLCLLCHTSTITGTCFSFLLSYFKHSASVTALHPHNFLTYSHYITVATQIEPTMSMSMSNQRQLAATISPQGSSSSDSRPSLDCVMDFDSVFQNDCAFPSLKTEMEAQAQRPRRSVSFQPMSALYLYEAPEPEDDFTLWRTEEDEELSKANARLELSLLRQMQSGEAPGGGRSLNADNLTTVGLEKYLVSPTMKRARLMRLVTCAVLMEQAYGVDNKAERIAYASIRLSKWSAEQARVVGKIQHRESTVLI